MSEPTQEGTPAPTAMQCDFCHQTVPRVRRVALDGDYERLRTPHAVMYSCPECFEKKDRRRLGLDRSAG
jgi:hypothetical protein